MVAWASTISVPMPHRIDGPVGHLVRDGVAADRLPWKTPLHDQRDDRWNLRDVVVGRGERVVDHWNAPRTLATWRDSA